MQYQEIMKKIGFNDQQIKLVEEYNIPKSAFNIHYFHFVVNRYGFYNYALRIKKKTINMFFLKFFMMAAERRFKSLLKHFDNNEELVLDQLSDLYYLSMSHFFKTRENGLSNYIYAGRVLMLNIIHIGPFEFQPVGLKQDTTINGVTYKKRQKAINVILLDYRKLTYENAVEAFKKSFLKYPTYTIYVCSHWILSPHLASALKEDSDIIKFQKLFNIYYNFTDVLEPEVEISKKMQTNYLGTQTEKEVIGAAKILKDKKQKIGLTHGIFIRRDVSKIIDQKK